METGHPKDRRQWTDEGRPKEESLGNRLLQQIKEICEIAGIKTEQYARMSRKRLDVLSIQREIARQKSALGQRVYELSGEAERGDLLEDGAVQATLVRIRELEAVLGDLDRELSEIRRAAHGRADEVRKRYEAERHGAQTDPAPVMGTLPLWDEPEGGIDPEEAPN